jgi:hypothetical protein
VEVNKQYQVKISNRFGALENMNDDVDINRAWKGIRGNINASAAESKQHKLWFDDECSKLLDQSRQVKVK